MKQLLLTIMMVLALVPGYSQEPADQAAPEGKIESAMHRLQDGGAKLKSLVGKGPETTAEAGPETTTEEGQESRSGGGIMGTLGGALADGTSLLSKMESLTSQWDKLSGSWDKVSTGWENLKGLCSEIKGLMVETIWLIQLLCIGVTLFVSLVPLLLVVAVVYLHKINSKLALLASKQ